ncbi:MAG: DNA primase [Bacteroides sp.]|nr:DNA primase [Bacillota bacterium]MCM1394193.1 DNA primase [[Eubacterium] siraeum]MCM1455946.1 DNA primase [Bacteroides sp.]
MSQGFTPEFLDELKYKCDIVEIISQYVPLQKKGSRYFGCCPFHHEKTGSFCVSQDSGFYHCFGCGVSGDVIKFIMEIESMSFFDAVKYLADKAGLPLPEMKLDPKFAEKKERSEVLKQLMRDAARYYRNNLVDPIKGKDAREYLLKRGIDEETSKRYGLGLSLDYDSLVAYLRRKEYNLKDLLDCGLIASTDRPFDAFANRIIVPIINSKNEVAAFGGRIYHGEENIAKYKNSTNTLLFDKGRTIYGVNYVKRDRHAGAVIHDLILVEGYMDVISLGAAGIRNAVAGMGTALTEGQAHELKRLVPKVYVCYDGDGAGKKATLRNVDTLVKSGLDVKVVSLDEGKDPDETVREYGAEGFMKHLADALPVTEYKLKLCENAYDLDTYEGRAKYLKSALTVLKSVEDESEREIYSQLVARLSRTSKDKLDIMLERTAAVKAEPIQQEKIAKSLSSSRFIINRIMNNARCARLADVDDEWILHPVHKEILAYARSVGEGKFNIGNMFSVVADDPEINAILDLQMNFANEMKEDAYFKDCLIALANDSISAKLDALKIRYSSLSDAGERRDAVGEISRLQRMLKSKSLGDKH